MSWSDADLRRLGDLIDSGLSSRKIAVTIRRPPGTVQGTAWRMGWAFGRPRTEEQQRAPLVPIRRQRKPRPRMDPSEAPIKFSCTFDRETYDAIVGRASAEGVSRLQIVRELVEWGLEAVEQGDRA